MTKAALLEHMAISPSWLMIFLTRETAPVSWVWSFTQWRLTRQLRRARGFPSGRNGARIVRHGAVTVMFKSRRSWWTRCT